MDQRDAGKCGNGEQRDETDVTDGAMQSYGTESGSSLLLPKTRLCEDVDDAAIDVSPADALLSSEIHIDHSLSSWGADVDQTLGGGSDVVAKTILASDTWWRHPRVRNNWKVVLSSLMLTIFGTCLAIVGAVIEASQSTVVQSYVFFAAAVICLIPGVYHLVFIYCAIKGTRGFSFYNMPVFK